MNFTPENTNIAVVGGGNIGTQVACVCASKGYNVNMFSSRSELFGGILEIVDEYEKKTVGRLNKASADICEAIDGCRIIFVCHPAFRLKDVAAQMLPYIKSSTIICVLPGTGGVEFSFRECVRKGAMLVGFQRVPSVARLEQYGKRVRCEGLRPELFLASYPNRNVGDFSEFVSALWNIPCTVLPNYLSVTLTPSNPILHTTRLRTLFADYEDGLIYKRNPLFYGEWSEASSELLIACDEELQAMLKLMGQLDLHHVTSLKQHYESDTVSEMTDKLRSIGSLHNLISPMRRVEGGWVPDFNSRYFTADFPYGLAIIEEFAKILGFHAHHIGDTMNWYRKVTGDKHRLALGEYGIHSIEDIYSFYEDG